MKLGLVIVLFRFISFVKGDYIDTNNEKCVKHASITGVLNCCAEKLLGVIDMATDVKSYEVFPGISIVSNLTSSSRKGKELGNKNKISDLPVNPYERNDKLIELLLNATHNFFATKSIQIHLPSSTDESISRALDEGRAKMKKMVGPWMLGLGAMALTMGPILIGGLTLFSVKSLLIAKMSLVVAVILFINYFFSSGGSNVLPNYFGNSYGYPSYGVPALSYVSPYSYSPSYSHGVNHLGGWNARSLSNKQTEIKINNKKDNTSSVTI